MSRQLSNSMSRRLEVMKFGGTSVGDSRAIHRVAEIVDRTAQRSAVVVVVSAMSGVTNELLEAARETEAGNRDRGQAIFHRLRARHRTAIRELIHSIPRRGRVNLAVEQLFEEGERVCEHIAALDELTLCLRDEIAGLGERISAPIIAAALNDCGLASQSVEAMELIRTSSAHGAAEPDIAATRELCQTRLRPLFEKGIVPVITGFIGATAEGVLTTLGRGGSDYSATILGAALDADEVTIWSDVDGLMTADPRLIHAASTIAEISCREAAELARAGAKVLHPKTLSPVAERSIPVRIRNTFSPEQTGTRITRDGARNQDHIAGLASKSDELDPSRAIVTAVGKNAQSSASVVRIMTALAEREVSLISILPATSECSFSFAVASHDLRAATEAVHGEFRLGAPNLPASAETLPAASEVWTYEPAQGTASAD